MSKLTLVDPNCSKVLKYFKIKLIDFVSATEILGYFCHIGFENGLEVGKEVLEN